MWQINIDQHVTKLTIHFEIYLICLSDLQSLEQETLVDFIDHKKTSLVKLGLAKP